MVYQKLDHGWARIDTDEILIGKLSHSLGSEICGLKSDDRGVLVRRGSGDEIKETLATEE